MNTENLVGSTLSGRYDIIEKIGSGGMASVFKAKDTLLNRYVAIKILRDALEGEEQVVSNFIKEAQSSASLSHNNVVSVFDVGEDQGINYMVMELVDGITLKEYIKAVSYTHLDVYKRQGLCFRLTRERVSRSQRAAARSI